LCSFNGSNGDGTFAPLIADANGDLFGTNAYCGPYGYGTVFEIKNIGTVAAPIYATAPTTLLNFNGSNGASPYAGLIADAKGDLFGTTENGGGDGTVFEIQNIGTVAVPVYAILGRAGTPSGRATTTAWAIPTSCFRKRAARPRSGI
jgi:hypothetical protein